MLTTTWSAAALAMEPHRLPTRQAQELAHSPGRRHLGFADSRSHKRPQEPCPGARPYWVKPKAHPRPVFHLQQIGDAHKQGNIVMCFHQYSPTLSQPSAQGPPQPEVVPLCLVNSDSFPDLVQSLLADTRRPQGLTIPWKVPQVSPSRACCSAGPSEVSPGAPCASAPATTRGPTRTPTAAGRSGSTKCFASPASPAAQAHRGHSDPQRPPHLPSKPSDETPATYTPGIAAGVARGAHTPKGRHKTEVGTERTGREGHGESCCVSAVLAPQPHLETRGQGCPVPAAAAQPGQNTGRGFPDNAAAPWSRQTPTAAGTGAPLGLKARSLPIAAAGCWERPGFPQRRAAPTGTCQALSLRTVPALQMPSPATGARMAHLHHYLLLVLSVIPRLQSPQAHLFSR